MRTDDGRIDHLQRGVRHSASREPFQDHVPDATVGPPPKLPKDRVPVAEALRQVAPRCAGSHQPKHRVEHAAMIAWRPAAAAMDQERFEVRPLIVGHQSANQGCPPQRAALNQFAILASIGLSTRPKAVEMGRTLRDAREGKAAAYVDDIHLPAESPKLLDDAPVIAITSGRRGEITRHGEGEANAEPLHPRQYELKNGKTLGSGRQ